MFYSFRSFNQMRRFGTKRLFQFTRIRHTKRTFASVAEENASKKSEETTTSWRENPNLKYWVIGVCAITGIIYRYVYKERDKKKLIVKNFPALPSHKLQNRDTDLTEIYNLYKSIQNGSVKIVCLEGYSGSGKTLLATSLAQKLAKEEEESYHFLPKNLFVGTINSANLDTLLFDVKKFAVAIGCQTKDWLLRLDEGTDFASLPESEQLHVILQAVKEKLVENPNWILIFDDVQDEKILQKVFDGDTSSWGKGSVILTSRAKLSEHIDRSFCLDNGMNHHEALSLLKDLTDLPEENLSKSEQIVRMLDYSPLAVACAGVYIKSKNQEDSMYSLDSFTNEFKEALNKFCQNNQTTLPQAIKSSYVVSSLLVKQTLNESPHFLHSFDLIGCCSPTWPIPVSLVSLHLRSPEYSLPPVPKSSPVLPGHPENIEIKPVKPEEEVEESFFSIKRLATNLESFTTAVKANYDAVKEIFNPKPLDFTPPSDGVLELMQTCPFVSSEKVNPGGVQAIRINSIVHDVLSQLFSTTTCQILEDQHLALAEDKHNNSSWFRRLQAFDHQRSLQEFRNSLVEKNTGNLPENNTGSPIESSQQVSHNIDVSCLLKEDNVDTTGYRLIQPDIAKHHYQRHLGLVLKTIHGVSSVCSQDAQTRTLARLIMPHLHRTLTNNTSSTLDPKCRVHALLSVASINSALGNLDASIPSLEQALGIQEKQFGFSSLEVASTLTRLAEVFSSQDDASKARDLLERAYGIYEQQRKKSGEYKNPLEFARTMEALGAVYGALGFKQESKDYIEKALSYMQASAPLAPDEIEGRRFTCEVASTLADLGHAYLSIGDAFSGRKMLELAVTGLKNMYGEEHPEVVRAMTILGTAYTMQGNWQEGKKMRKEAGKLQAKLDTVVAL